MVLKTITLAYGNAIISGSGEWIVICATDDEAHEYSEEMEEVNASENLQ